MLISLALVARVFSVASLAQPLPPFATPTVISGTSANLQASTAIDITKDSAPDLFSQGIFLSNFAVSLNHAGSRIKQNWLPFFNLPAYPASSLPMIQGMDRGNIDGDLQKLDDLAVVSNSGAVVWLPNAGNHLLSGAVFGAPQIIDFFGPSAVINPPFLTYSNPVIRVVDFDADGLLDVVVAGGRVDMWSAATQPGVLKFYRNAGSGNFLKYSLPIPGPAIDLEVADLDANGVLDHIALVTEASGYAVGAFAYELHHARFNSTLTQPFYFSQPTQYLPLRVTAMEIGKVAGSSSKDYAFSTVTFSGMMGASSVYYYEGDGLGGLGSWGLYSIPANTTGLGDTIYSIRLKDLDGDGTDDLVLLRNFTRAQPFGSSLPPLMANAELLVAMGPSTRYSTMNPIPLPGVMLDGNTSHAYANLLPMRPCPDALQWMDLGMDGVPDLFVGPLDAISTGPSGLVSTRQVVTFRNLTPPQQGSPKIEMLGAPSGGSAVTPGTLGFDGGRPTVGNAQFGINLQNIPSNAVAGFVWGPVGYENLFVSQEGITAHLPPVEYSYTYLTSGSGSLDGFARQPIPIPNNPSLIGDAGAFQGVYYHPSLGFGGTSALLLTVGQ